MPNTKTDYLVDLINSMTKSEKRSFTLFAQRNQSSDDLLFLKLFDEIRRRGDYREEEILQNIKGIKKSQLSNLKAHLYKQILSSLRVLSKNKPYYLIREGIDHATILFNKGLYQQSLEILNRMKAKAYEYELHDLILMILDKEKYIESQFITNSFKNRAAELEQETNKVLSHIERKHKLSNLSLSLYSYYLDKGYVKDEEEYEEITVLFQSLLPDYDSSEFGFYEQMYWNKSYCWYYYVTQDFAGYYRYGLKWFQTFSSFPQMMEIEFSMYLKAIHNLLSGLFIAERYPKFSELFQILADAPSFVSKMSWNEEGMYHLYFHLHQLNHFMLEGKFTEATEKLEPLIKLLKKNPYHWDEYRIMTFYYKIASLYFGAGQFGESIKYLNKVTNNYSQDFRSDIQSFSKILSLIAHYERGNQKLIEYQIKSVYRYLSKMEELQDVQLAIFRFLKDVLRLGLLDIKDRLKELYAELEPLQNDPLQKRAFLYLDIMSWLEAKLQKRTVEEVLREKFVKASLQEVG